MCENTKNENGDKSYTLSPPHDVKDKSLYVTDDEKAKGEDLITRSGNRLLTCAIRPSGIFGEDRFRFGVRDELKAGEALARGDKCVAGEV